MLHTVRGYDKNDLGSRIRVIWSGAEYRGRGRETNWKGSVVFAGSKITKFEKINVFNHERLWEQKGDDTIVFDAITSGNFVRFDV